MNLESSFVTSLPSQVLGGLAATAIYNNNTTPEKKIDIQNNVIYNTLMGLSRAASGELGKHLINTQNIYSIIPALTAQVGLNAGLGGLLGYAAKKINPSIFKKDPVIGGLLAGLPGGDLWGSKYMYDDYTPGLVNLAGNIVGNSLSHAIPTIKIKSPEENLPKPPNTREQEESFSVEA